jgi:hypothetical protein
MRTVIIHYHLFKNAGTSLDHALRAGLRERWVAYEHPHRILALEIAAYLAEHPKVVVLSSHNAWLPPPAIPDTVVIPVVFVRHPLDRARSVFDFERGQEADTAGARMAQQTDLAGYLEWRLGPQVGRDPTIRDFQTQRLAPAGQGTTDLERALDAVDRLPYVGLVEEYARSIGRLERLLEPYLPGLRLRNAHLNRTADAPHGLEDRLEHLRSRVGDVLYRRLLEANQDDLAVWEHVRQRYVTAERVMGPPTR